MQLRQPGGSQEPILNFQPAHKARMTVVGYVHYEPVHGPAQQVEYGFTRWIDSDEQPYGPRNLIVTEQWKPLDCGWIGEENGEGAGQLVIVNLEGRYLSVNPSEAEKRMIDGKVVELGVMSSPNDPPTPTSELPAAAIIPFAFIRPRGDAPRFEPVHCRSIFIRCQKGTARCSVTLFPR